jgi:imidazolonepropionase-like amidohydrolase
MRMRGPRLSPVLLAAGLLSGLSGVGQASGPQPATLTAFTGATLMNGTGVSPDAVIVVRNGRIERIGPAPRTPVPEGARVVDLKGRFVVPGLISTHAHVSDVQGAGPRAYTRENTLRQLGLFARYGITSVWSLGGERAPAFDARDAQATAELDRARIHVAGDVISAATPAEARRRVAAVAAREPDIIKIRVDDNLGTSPKMAPDVYRAVIDEAHTRGLRVAAHIFSLDDAKALLRAGVDMIAHSVRDAEIDDEFVALMRARDVPYCPTLTRELATFVYRSTPSFFSDPFFRAEADPALVARLSEPARQQAMRDSRTAQAYETALQVARRNVRRAVAAGLLVVMGTDSGAFPERFEGYFEHLELEMMVESGMTPAQALRAATGDAARAMRTPDVGTLAEGRWADLLVLDRNPLDDIRNTRAIASVWIAGHQVPR